MDKAKQLIIAKDLILEGKITEFADIFNYIDRKFIHTKTGMNYYRLLRNVKNPKGFTFDDVYNIARVLKVPPAKIAEIIMNQIEAGKKKG
jgi:hypothetical protein